MRTITNITPAHAFRIVLHFAPKGWAGLSLAHVRSGNFSELLLTNGAKLSPDPNHAHRFVLKGYASDGQDVQSILDRTKVKPDKHLYL